MLRKIKASFSGDDGFDRVVNAPGCHPEGRIFNLWIRQAFEPNSLPRHPARVSSARLPSVVQRAPLPSWRRSSVSIVASTRIWCIIHRYQILTYRFRRNSVRTNNSRVVGQQPLECGAARKNAESQMQTPQSGKAQGIKFKRKIKGAG